MTGISYNSDSFLPVRFFNHAVLGLKTTISGREQEDKNYLEKMGDFLVWSVDRFPRIVWNKFQDPRAITITLTVAALLANSFLFYPVRTHQALMESVKFIGKYLPFEKVKFAAYVHSCSVIIGAASRAYGRFSNEDLMKKFYAGQV